MFPYLLLSTPPAAGAQSLLHLVGSFGDDDLRFVVSVSGNPCHFICQRDQGQRPHANALAITGEEATRHSPPRRRNAYFV